MGFAADVRKFGGAILSRESIEAMSVPLIDAAAFSDYRRAMLRAFASLTIAGDMLDGTP